jgi:ATP-dependent Clp protease adaptor protein ClpS
MAKSTVSPETEVINRAELTPLYRVVLLDDDDHTYDYVIEMLQKITCDLPEAEFARDQIHAYGPDWRLPRSKGSMSAIVEPAGCGNSN